jgi:WD40 repeat protein
VVCRSGACVKHLASGTTSHMQPVGADEVVSAETDGSVRIWNLTSGQNVHSFPGNWRNQITCLQAVRSTFSFSFLFRFHFFFN